MILDEMFIIVIITQGTSLLQINLINSKTSQNQMISNYNSKLAIDGNTETCSITESNSNEEKHPWWRVELDRIYKITNLTISYTSPYSVLMNNWNIYVSNKAENYEAHSCISFVGHPKDVPIGQILLKCQNPINGIFVTITRVGGFKNKTLILCEVQLEAFWNTDNLAFGRPTIESGRILNGKAEFAVDGNLDTCAAFKSNDNQFAWWRVILDQNYYITNVSVYFTGNLTGISAWMHITAYISNDKDYFEEQTCAFSSYPDFKIDKKRNIDLICKKPTLGTYVTIKKYGGQRPKWFILCEVEVYSNGTPTEMNTTLSSECLPHEYKCHQGRCIHKNWLCDDTQDCPFGDDEAPSCPRCDGYLDCPSYSDEHGCLKTDLENGFLKSTFHGEPDFYICSTGWFPTFSIIFCAEQQRSYLATLFESPQAAKFKHLNVFESPNTSHLDIGSFANGLSCKSNTFVKVQCDNQTNTKSSICGTRGFPDGDFEPYVINGEKAQDGAWPWNAQIFLRGIFACGGSIINENWILTAAHCLRNIKSSEVYVKVGTNVVDDPQEPKLIVSHFASHPEYAGSTTADIALIRLKTPIKFTKFIRPICLPDHLYDWKKLRSFRHCVLSGFGRTSMNESILPKYLQQGRMNLLSELDCRDYVNGLSVHTERYDDAMLDSHLCGGTFPTIHGVNACKGDSGSALVCKDYNRIWTQVGIYSFNFKLKDIECSNSIFTKVDHFLDFIYEVISKEFKTDQETSKAWRTQKITIFAIVVYSFMCNYLIVSF